MRLHRAAHNVIKVHNVIKSNFCWELSQHHVQYHNSIVYWASIITVLYIVWCTVSGTWMFSKGLFSYTVGFFKHVAIFNKYMMYSRGFQSGCRDTLGCRDRSPGVPQNTLINTWCIPFQPTVHQSLHKHSRSARSQRITMWRAVSS